MNSLSETNIGKAFWDATYAEGLVYGKKPSRAIKEALHVLEAQDLIIPSACFLELGCGYGRDLAYVCEQAYFRMCRGIDISEQAINLAGEFLREWTHPEMLIRGDVLNLLKNFDWKGCSSSYIYTHYFLQLYDKEWRKEVFDAIIKKCPVGGILILSEYSSSDARYKTGYEVEPGTFVLYPDRPQHKIHFFTEEEIDTLSTGYDLEVIYKTEYDEPEEIRGSTLCSRSWLVIFRKRREVSHHAYLPS